MVWATHDGDDPVMKTPLQGGSLALTLWAPPKIGMGSYGPTFWIGMGPLGVVEAQFEKWAYFRVLCKLRWAPAPIRGSGVAHFGKACAVCVCAACRGVVE